MRVLLGRIWRSWFKLCESKARRIDSLHSTSTTTTIPPPSQFLSSGCDDENKKTTKFKALSILNKANPTLGPGSLLCFYFGHIPCFHKQCHKRSKVKAIRIACTHTYIFSFIFSFSASYNIHHHRIVMHPLNYYITACIKSKYCSLSVFSLSQLCISFSFSR